MSVTKRIMKEELKRGETLLGIGILSNNTDFVEVAGMAGFDFIYLDREHTTVSWETLKGLIVAADAVNTPVIVRVEENDVIMIRKALEVGAQGILIPHVNTKEEALRAVRAAKFPPEGVRGAELNVRSGRFSTKDWKTYVDETDRETLVSILIEDREAMKHIDDVLSVEGLDAVCFGPVDYSFSMGLSGDREHPLVQRDFDILIKKCKERGIFVQYTPVPQDLSSVKSAIERGVSMLFLGDDLSAFQLRCIDLIENVYKKIKG
ncbi:MAG: aldolase/citrate lyase family protein [Candidatus Bathyarchaeia archaeon]